MFQDPDANRAAAFNQAFDNAAAEHRADGAQEAGETLNPLRERSSEAGPATEAPELEGAWSIRARRSGPVDNLFGEFAATSSIARVIAMIVSLTTPPPWAQSCRGGIKMFSLSTFLDTSDSASLTAGSEPMYSPAPRANLLHVSSRTELNKT